MAKIVPTRPTVHGEGLFQSLAGPIPARANAETQALFRQLQRRRWSSPYTGPRLIDRLADHVLAPALASRRLPDTLDQAFEVCARGLVACEAQLFDCPALPPAHSVVQGVTARALLRERLAFFDHEQDLVTTWIARLTSCLTAIVTALPAIDAKPAALVVPVPILALVDRPAELITRLVSELMSLAPDPAAPVARPGAQLAARITDNLLAASRMSFDDAQKRPDRLRWPHSEKATPQELIERYLATTPFAPLFEASIPLPVGHRTRFEHGHVLARVGHGKTQLLQTWMLADFDDPLRPAVVAIDSQGDMINTLSRLQRFADNDRLTILDPADTQWPLRLNLFDINRARIDKLGLGQREEILAGIVELYEYVFGALLGSELTGKQSVVFRFLAQLMITIPDATIHTLIEILEDPSPYVRFFDQLPPTARTFLAEHLFASKDTQYRETRRQVLRRLFHVLSNPAFERMFSHPRNGLDMQAALAPGKVLLINTAKSRLKAEWSAIFGRFMIARIMQAVFERAAVPEHKRHPLFIYIDEAHEYFDGNIDSLLISARKYRAGLVLAHQTIDQLKTGGLRASVLGMPAIRFCGDVSAADASTLAPEMRTTADLLTRLRKRDSSTEFAAHIRNITPTAVKVTLPFLAAECAPKMSDAAYAKLLARIRSQVAAPLSTVTSNPPAHTPSTDPDDFADRY